MRLGYDCPDFGFDVIYNLAMREYVKAVKFHWQYILDSRKLFNKMLPRILSLGRCTPNVQKVMGSAPRLGHEQVTKIETTKCVARKEVRPLFQPYGDWMTIFTLPARRWGIRPNAPRWGGVNITPWLSPERSTVEKQDGRRSKALNMNFLMHAYFFLE